jgi:O-antigen/teichoic acid export membrane protein
MGLVIRQSIQSSIISYAGVAIGYINLLYLYPKFLSLEQVGLFRTIQDAAILFAPFAQFGLAQTIVRYYPRLVKDKKSSQAFINLILLLSLLGFGIFFLVFKIFEASILSYFEDNAAQLIQYTSIVIGSTLLLVLIAVLEAFSRSLLKTVIPNLLREVVSRLLLSILVLLYFSQILTFDQFIMGSLISYLIWLVVLISYLWLKGELTFNTSFTSLDRRHLPDLLQFSLLSFAGMAGMILVGKLDSIMVSAMLDFAANAIYTTAFYMATVIEIPKRALSQLAMPLISRAFERGDTSEIASIYKKTSINQMIVGFLLLIGVWINLDNVFALMPNGDSYQVGKWVVIIVGGGKLMDMIFGPSSEIIVLSRYYAFNIVMILLLAVVVVVSNNILIPQMGIEGAAWGSALALTVFNVVKFFFIYWKVGVQPFQPKTVLVMVIGGISFLFNYLIPKLDILVLDIILRSSDVKLVLNVNSPFNHR